MLLKSLVTIGALTGVILGVIGTCVPWLFPKLFSPDAEIIRQVSESAFTNFLLNWIIVSL